MSTLFCIALLATSSLACRDGGTTPEGPPAMEWHEVASPLGTINVALVRPDPGSTGPHPVIFALPWGGGTPDLVVSLVSSYWDTAAPARGYYVVAPSVLGSSLSENADEVIVALFEWMTEELDFDPAAVVITGASNGGRGSFFAAVQQPERFAAIIGMPGYYAGPDEDLAVLAGKPIWLMAGEFDESWVASTTATRDALESLGIDVLHSVLPGQGHVLNVTQRSLMDWVDEALGR